MDKTTAADQVKAAPSVVAPVRKRSVPIQKPVTKRGIITLAQARAAIRWYHAQAQAK